MADTYTIDLCKKIPDIKSKHGAFRFLSAEVTVARSPLVVIRYSKGGIPQDHCLRMDMDKKVIIDDFNMPRRALLKRTPIIWAAIATQLKS